MPIRRWLRCLAAGAGCLLAVPAQAQQPDTAAPAVALPAITVSATRTTLPLPQVPRAVQILDRRQISAGRPTWGLDEALGQVPGVFVANRYNFSLDQRISIRGFGSRSAFAVRGIKVLVDGIPQTLPDGQGQLTNLELGDVDRIEVLRGSASALFGNASGGVISLWTDPAPLTRVREDARFLAGWSARRGGRGWNKWQSTTGVPVGGGSAELTVSRLSYEGERDHSAADLRNLNTRLRLPLGPGWDLAAVADMGDDPRADNPGALTLAELQANRDSAPAVNLSSHAGKDVTQAQGGATLRHPFAAGGEIGVTVFGLTRELKNPTTFAYIDLGRRAYGARVMVSRPLGQGRLAPQLTTGMDFQRQRDDRVNFGNVAGRPDTTRTLDQLEHVTEVGPFVQGTVPLASRATLTAGVRYDWVHFQVGDRLVSDSNPDDSGDRLMRALSGSVGVAFNPSPAVTLYANAGSSFETPTTTELANRPDTAGGFNPTLDPQSAWTYEIGSRGAVASRGEWSIAAFQADVSDELISYEVPSSPERRFFRNAGSARHRGLELGGGVALLAGLELRAAYTYSDFRYVHYAFSPDTSPVRVLDGRPLPGIPKHAVHLTLHVEPRSIRGGWLDIETTGTSSTLVDDTLPLRTRPWWTTNVRLGWMGRADRTALQPFLAVNNIFDRLYVGSVVINAARGRYYEPAPGRNVYLGLSIGAGR
jgi:iron complex outermembrane recepter protein